MPLAGSTDPRETGRTVTLQRKIDTGKSERFFSQRPKIKGHGNTQSNA